MSHAQTTQTHGFKSSHADVFCNNSMEWLLGSPGAGTPKYKLPTKEVQSCHVPSSMYSSLSFLSLQMQFNNQRSFSLPAVLPRKILMHNTFTCLQKSRSKQLPKVKLSGSSMSILFPH